MLVGVAEGEGMKVGLAATVEDKGLKGGDVVGAMDGIAAPEAISPHPTRQGRISIVNTLKYLLTMPLLQGNRA